MTIKPEHGILPVRRLDPAAILPKRAHPDDAGLDLFGLEDIVVAPGEGKVLRSGVAVAVPAGHVGLVCDRSSLAR